MIYQVRLAGGKVFSLVQFTVISSPTEYLLIVVIMMVVVVVVVMLIKMVGMMVVVMVMVFIHDIEDMMVVVMVMVFIHDLEDIEWTISCEQILFTMINFILIMIIIKRNLSWAPTILGPCLGTTTTRRSPNFESVAKVGASSLT